LDHFNCDKYSSENSPFFNSNFNKKTNLTLLNESTYRLALSELAHLYDPTLKTPLDPNLLLQRLVDSNSLIEFKPNFAPTVKTCFARIQSRRVGIITNNGVLFSDTANKMTQFIQLCNNQNIPLLFLHNISGFMIGKMAERGGIAKHGAKLVNAVSCA